MHPKSDPGSTRNDWFLPKDIRQQLEKHFQSLKHHVALELFPDTGRNREHSEYTAKLCADLDRLSDRITFTTHEADSARARELDITAFPTLCINPDSMHIRFLGAPIGEESRAFITTILLVSMGTAGLSPVSSDLLRELNEERFVQVFVNPSCPYCPGQFLNAVRCAIHSPKRVRAECVDSTENPELAERHNVGSVPHTVINNTFTQLGLMPEERFVVELLALRSAEDLLADGSLPGVENSKAPDHYGSLEKGEVDLVIVGAGPAGLTAGIYAARAGLKAVVLEKGLIGGQVALTPVVENYPGFATVPGKQLMDIMSEHAREYVPIREGEGVEHIETGERIEITTNRAVHSARAVLLATGSTWRKLGVPGEDTCFGKGVNYCASCDGYLYKGKRVAIAGGGNTALTDALHLRNLGVAVTIIHRRDAFRAQDHLIKSVEHAGIPIRWNTVVTRIRETHGKLAGLDLRNVLDGRESELDVDGLFIAIGQTANTDLARELGVELDENGFIRVDEAMRTNVPRVYAAGDVTGGVQQIVTAIGEGSVAAMSAFEDISSPYWRK
ncbi:FAD-dependent oxidoreductase [Pseudodesulfovibrio tunisiensis]|uniref:FAD-dependent oxidoreductase n=1 Tax=Pseudodesulfovibrio tunisiensis TaxID=463192 RepID=UPI001FB1BA28|nr:FAD-dependent oxidoreductase [Pseudodesulfovibrio tunisiensis]